ncbi:MAG: PAS domain S-box protein, partial [Anaerolineae bacterium]
TDELTTTNEQLVAEITERKQTEETLRQSEERFRDLYENAPNAYFSVGVDGRIRKCNSRAGELLGSAVEELVGRPVFELYADTSQGKEKAAKVFQGFRAGEVVTDEELQIQRADGTPVWISLTINPIRDAQGRVVASRSMVMDITERKRAEEALQRSELLYHSTIDSIDYSIHVVDTDLRFTLFNTAFTQWCEKLDLETDVLGRNLFEAFPFLPDQARDEYQQVFDTGETLATEENITIKGQEFITETRKIPVLEEGQVARIITVIHDVTEQRQVEKAMRQQEQLAAIGQLAGGIAHDFNNLLTTIMLYAQIPLRKDNLPPDLAQSFETILSESQRAADLVEQILDFSRHTLINVQPLDLGQFTTKVIGILHRTIPENIHLRMAVGTEECVVQADPTRIQQVLMNLATNARDAMPEGGELRFDLSKIKVMAEGAPAGGKGPPLAGMSSGEWVHLAVSDTGTGITEEAQARLFQPFFTTKEPGKGTGLGLAQVYGIVKLHDGHIGVDTAIGRGTTFHIYLPVYEAEAAEGTGADKPSAPPKGTGETILLVEDNKELRQVGQSILKSLGYQVLAAANGREALDMYQSAERKERVDLLITDLVMPEMGGRRLFQELKEMIPDLKALAITGYTILADRQELEEAGFLSIIHKPFDLDTLAEVVRRALDTD